MSQTNKTYKRSRCRVCNNEDLEMFLTLGPTPLANSFLNSKEEAAQEDQFPLDVYFCPECSLVQVMDVVDPEILFRDYIYVTGTSDTIISHNQEYAKNVVEIMGLRPGQKVAEIASNNGNLLSCFSNLGMEVLGIEPATNIAKMANEAGINTVNEFFTLESAESLSNDYGTFRAVIGNNVLAHVDDTVGFLQGCEKMIDNDGRVIFEVPYLGEFLNHLEYDTVYHEHLCYFSVSALAKLCEASGLRIVRVDKRPVHGGSIRVQAQKVGFCGQHSADVLELIETEIKDGLQDLATYSLFAEKVDQNRTHVLELLHSIKKDHRTIAGYGAAAKGNTFLNYCGIGRDLIDFVVDRNPLKIGKLTPGVHLPVYDVVEIANRKPDYMLILAWNFADEIMKQQSEFSERGGKFIVALPEPRII